MISTDDNHDYYAGRRDGRIGTLETMMQNQGRRIDDVMASLKTIERIVYGLIGAIALIEIVPALKAIL